ncbi:MAG: UDP-2,3-diacylglucosamine diphosphatase LpxI [Limisphaerales bacterium]
MLAVEGFEGTDKCLARGGELAGKNGGAVAVKVAKPNHDMRFERSLASACRRWRRAPAPGVAVLALNPAGRFCLNAKLAKCWQKKINSPHDHFLI